MTAQFDPFGTDARRADAQPLRPIVKWPGGKSWLVPYVRPAWRLDDHRRLVELFAGGAALSFALRPSTAVLNDANPHLINLYAQVARGIVFDEMHIENTEASYYAARDRLNELIGLGQARTTEAAAIFLFLNRAGYNGLCRFNQRGQFNVPYGRYKSVNLAREFPDHAAALATWTLTSGDFADVDLEAGDFIFADPPYDAVFTDYTATGFAWRDQVRLVELLAGHTGPIIAMNAATDRIVKLYEEHGFNIRIMDAPRRISCTGDRAPAREMCGAKNFESSVRPLVSSRPDAIGTPRVWPRDDAAFNLATE